MAHRNIPIFIPHLGCPNQCVFCNQRSISGQKEFHEEDVARILDASLSDRDGAKETEIAFFGGSFTGIDRGLMIRLLDTAESYIRAGRAASIRLSTRPDYISGEILGILSRYHVKEIELGLQSMDDAVLKASHRGHTAKQAEDACRAVVDAGFSLTGQMMIGLPGATPESEVLTAQKIAALGASAARIYPTVVFFDTPLCQMAKDGSYTPLSLSEAVTRSAAALAVFEEQKIPVIRVGLCASEELTSPETVYAGPNHPALGELVRAEGMHQRVLTSIARAGACGKRVVLTVPRGKTSQAVGQHRQNLHRLEAETGTQVVSVREWDDDCIGVTILTQQKQAR